MIAAFGVSSDPGLDTLGLDYRHRTILKADYQGTRRKQEEHAGIRYRHVSQVSLGKLEGQAQGTRKEHMSKVVKVLLQKCS